MDKYQKTIRMVLGVGLMISFVWLAFGFVKYRSLLTYWGDDMTSYGYWLAPENENVLGLEIISKYTGEVVSVYSEGTEEPKYFLVLKIDSGEEITLSLPDMVIDGGVMRISNRTSNSPTFEVLDCDLCVMSRLNGAGGKDISMEISRYTKASDVSYIKQLVIYED